MIYVEERVIFFLKNHQANVLHQILDEVCQNTSARLFAGVNNTRMQCQTLIHFLAH